MKTLKNINHWVGELRSIAYRKKLFNEENTLITKAQKKLIFSKNNFEGRFHDGLTPQEAFDSEMDFWMNAIW